MSNAIFKFAAAVTKIKVPTLAKARKCILLSTDNYRWFSQLSWGQLQKHAGKGRRGNYVSNSSSQKRNHSHQLFLKENESTISLLNADDNDSTYTCPLISNSPWDVFKLLKFIDKHRDELELFYEHEETLVNHYSAAAHGGSVIQLDTNNTQQATMKLNGYSLQVFI